MAGGFSQKYAYVTSTVARSTLKRYFEIHMDAAWADQPNPPTTGAGDLFLGVSTFTGIVTAAPSTVWQVRTATPVGAPSVASGDGNIGYPTRKRLNVALDFTALKMWVGFDGTWIGDPVAGTGNSFTLAAATPYYCYAGAGNNRYGSSPLQYYPYLQLQALLRTRGDQFTDTIPSGFVSFATPE